MTKRATVVLAVVFAVFASLLTYASTASAVAVPRGYLDVATQTTTTHNVAVTGWAFDPAHAGSKVVVSFYGDGRLVARAYTTVARPDVNRVFRLSGIHGFRLVLHPGRKVSTLQARVTSAATGKLISVASRRTAQYTPPGARIMAAAKKYYVAHVPYVYGGTTPRGFDCSGYTQYVYRVAAVKPLPRTAEQQRRATKRISQAQLQPGDLVFYMGGGSAYHVAIYAGNGMQYAEATPRDGLRYQKIWSSAVQYGTNWH